MFRSLFFSTCLIGTMFLSMQVPSALAGDRHYRTHHRHSTRYNAPRYCHHNVSAYTYQSPAYYSSPPPRYRHRHHQGGNVRFVLPLPPLPHHIIFGLLHR